MVDVLIAAMLATYAVFGYRRGFFGSMIEFVGFLLGLVLAFALAKPLGGWLASTFHGSRGLWDLGAFLMVWTVVELAVARGWKLVHGLIPERIDRNPANHLLGVFPAVLKGAAFVTIMLLILVSAPIPGGAKEPFTDSRLGKVFLGAGTTFQQQVNAVFGEALRDTLAFKTVETGSSEVTALGFKKTGTAECLADGRGLFEKANAERRRRNLVVLTWDDSLRKVGLAHSRDMLARGYFAHLNPDGEDPFDRMEQAGITYTAAGENLAFAPTVSIAHTGLMNSPGHRANILKDDFRKLGVGCADAGIRGKMFSQEFTG